MHIDSFNPLRTCWAVSCPVLFRKNWRNSEFPAAPVRLSKKVKFSIKTIAANYALWCMIREWAGMSFDRFHNLHKSVSTGDTKVSIFYKSCYCDCEKEMPICAHSENKIMAMLSRDVQKDRPAPYRFSASFSLKAVRPASRPIWQHNSMQCCSGCRTPEIQVQNDRSATQFRLALLAPRCARIAYRNKRKKLLKKKKSGSPLHKLQCAQIIESVPYGL